MLCIQLVAFGAIGSIIYWNQFSWAAYLIICLLCCVLVWAAERYLK